MTDCRRGGPNCRLLARACAKAPLARGTLGGCAPDRKAGPRSPYGAGRTPPQPRLPYRLPPPRRAVLRSVWSLGELPPTGRHKPFRAAQISGPVHLMSGCPTRAALPHAWMWQDRQAREPGRVQDLPPGAAFGGRRHQSGRGCLALDPARRRLGSSKPCPCLWSATQAHPHLPSVTKLQTLCQQAGYRQTTHPPCGQTQATPDRHQP